MPTPIAILAFRPFLEPIDIHQWWYALLPVMSLGVAVAYKAVRAGSYARYWHEVAAMTIQITLGIGSLALGLILLLRYILPTILPSA